MSEMISGVLFRLSQPTVCGDKFGTQINGTIKYSTGSDNRFCIGIDPIVHVNWCGFVDARIFESQNRTTYFPVLGTIWTGAGLGEAATTLRMAPRRSPRSLTRSLQRVILSLRFRHMITMEMTAISVRPP